MWKSLKSHLEECDRESIKDKVSLGCIDYPAARLVRESGLSHQVLVFVCFFFFPSNTPGPRCEKKVVGQVGKNQQLWFEVLWMANGFKDPALSLQLR